MLQIHTSVFLGSEYYCECGYVPIYKGLPSDYIKLYPDNPLVVNNVEEMKDHLVLTPNMSWFMITLNETTTEDIELRMCVSEHSWDEDTPLKVIDLYIC